MKNHFDILIKLYSGSILKTHNNIENIQEMNDLNDIIINSEPGYIKDIKQECQKLSIEEIRTKIVSELTGEDIK